VAAVIVDHRYDEPHALDDRRRAAGVRYVPDLGGDGHCRHSYLYDVASLGRNYHSCVQPMDGDTFELAGVVIRLAEVDAPEISQKCEGGPKELRSCGAFVGDALAERIGGQTVESKVHGIDEYDRRLASCSHAGEDLSTWLVTEGLAVAFRRFSERLVAEEMPRK
jgi:endonuclease YncB( thermonuclease family)